MAVDLFDHNRKAYQAAAQMLETCGKAAVVHPTGTGKSFIAFKLVEDNSNASFLWLSPSAYIFKTQCESVQRGAPELDLSRISFYTYAKLLRCTQPDLEAMAAQKPDFIILDEVHRACAPQWSAPVETLLSLCPQAKLLGLTATPIRYLDAQKDSVEHFFGDCVASEMTLGEAIVRGILPAPKYVTTVFQYQQQLRQYQARIDSIRSDGIRGIEQKYLDALRRALEQADGLDQVFARHMTETSGKYIVFCSGLEHMKEMIACSREWFAAVNPERHIYTAYSDDPATSEAFAGFKADNSPALKLLFCIDMLNEGIHVKDIAGVILFRPTISPIVYKQQIGRALTSGEKGRVPLILDIVNNFEGLTSIASVQAEMQTAIQRMYAEGEGNRIVTDRFTVIEQVHDCRVLFEQLHNSLSGTWEQYFAAASVYAAEHGNLQISKSYVTPGGLKLGEWVLSMRRIRRGSKDGTLTPERIARLDSLGMVWDNPQELAWERNYALAKEYFEKYGDLRVPADYVAPDGTKLGAWISNQRTARKEGRQQALLSAERIARLDAIGMSWDVVSEQWERNYLEAVRYYNAHGHLRVPVSFKAESGFALGHWIQNLRQAKNGTSATRLTQDQAQRLEAIGMEWGNRNDAQWTRAYRQAKAYYEKHGDLQVPLDYVAPDGTRLGKWIARQRSARKGSKGEHTHLTAERIAKLEAIGMDWRSEDPWEHRYELVRKYRAEHGNLNIPAQYKTADGIWLGKWLYEQRRILRGEDTHRSLTARQREKLLSLEGEKVRNLAHPRQEGA